VAHEFANEVKPPSAAPARAAIAVTYPTFIASPRSKRLATLPVWYTRCSDRGKEESENGGFFRRLFDLQFEALRKVNWKWIFN